MMGQQHYTQTNQLLRIKTHTHTNYSISRAAGNEQIKNKLN